MKDFYPDYATLPSGHLVPPELQPEYSTVPGALDHDTANLGDLLVDTRVRAGDGGRMAIIHHESGRHVTYAELSRESSQLANALVGLGVEPGDRVAFRAPNCPEAIVTALACWKVGAVVVPTPVQSRGAELRFFLEDTGARVLVTAAGLDDLEAVEAAVAGTDVAQVIAFGKGADDTPHLSWAALSAAASGSYRIPALSADSLALIWHTGGTTGQPKGCYHTHRRFLQGGWSVGEALPVRPGERMAAATPLGHALGFIYHTIFSLLHGATAVLIEDFTQPTVLADAIKAHRVQTFTAITATWARLLEVVEGDPTTDASSLTRAYAMWQSASSATVHDAWRDRGLELLNNFGSTAFATWVLVPRAGDRVPLASLGRPAPGYEVCTIEPDSTSVAPLEPGSLGRMAVRGPTGLTYWNRPALQERDVCDGWTLSDDLIQFDGDGNAAYLGRTDYIISTAGYKVAPVEVEGVLARHPAVREVAVMGTPDDIRQEVVTAFVALVDGVEPSAAVVKELQDLVKRELSPYKYPRRVEFIDALPRDHVGKVQPRRLLEDT